MKSTLCLLVVLILPVNAQSDWKQWRGPTGQGHADANLPTHWNETQNIKWRTPVPGKGWSSPVIEGDQIWLTAAHETLASAEETAERLKNNPDDQQPVVVLSLLRLHAVCVDKHTGKLLHDVEILRKKNPQWAHKLNSYASPTPVIEDGKLYCHFGAYGTACVDTRTAKVLWLNRDLFVTHKNGPGSSPVLWKDKLIFHMDGSDKQFIVALNKDTGKVAWRTARSGEMHVNPQCRIGYGTPLVLEVNAQPTLFSTGADWLYAYNPNTGKELWKLSYGVLGFSIVPRPVAGHGMLFLSTSFMRPHVLAVRVDAKEPEIVWSYNRGAPSTPSPLLVGDELYFVSDSGGIVTCLNAHSGKENWRERVGGNHSASPLHAQGKIYFHNAEGETAVLQAGKTYKVLANNKLNGRLMASAAIDGNAFILRTDKALYRIENEI